MSEYPPGTPPVGKNFPVRNRIISGMALGVIVVEAAEKSGALITVEHAIEQGREVFAVPGSVNSTQSKGSHQLLRDGAKLVESVDDVLEELPTSTYVHLKVINPPQGPAWELFGEESVDSSQNIASSAASSSDNTTTATKSLPTENVSTQQVEKPAVTPMEDTILALLGDTPRHVDEIIAISELTPAQVSATLLMLELKGYALRLPGSHFLKK